MGRTRPRTAFCCDCKTSITAGATRCIPCASRKQWQNPSIRAQTIETFRKNHPSPPHPTCLDCGLTLTSRTAKRCSPCYQQYRRQRGSAMSAATKDKIRHRALARYKNPAYKTKWKTGIAQRTSSDEWKTKIRNVVKSNLTNPKWLAKIKDTPTKREQGGKWRASMKNNPCWQRGENHPCWNGHTNERKTASNSREYKEWRNAVFNRDNHTCQHCFHRGGNLHAHHLQGWATHPELRYVVSNGLTVCQKCHSKIHGRFVPGHKWSKSTPYPARQKRGSCIDCNAPLKKIGSKYCKSCVARRNGKLSSRHNSQAPLL